MYFGFIGREFGIDIGTVNTLISKRNEGIILRERSAIALNRDKRIVAVGEDAIAILGRTPGDVQVANPMSDGVIVDYELCEAMLKHFLAKCMGQSSFFRNFVRAVLCVPGCITNIEKRALEEAARNAGARTAFILDEPVAAALGVGLPIDAPVGTLIVDIGGGTTDAAILAMGGVVVRRTVRAGGVHIDNAIIQHLRQTYGLLIGSRTAEILKISVGSAIPTTFNGMEVRGRDINTGLPATLKISAMEVYRAMQPQIQAMVNCVREVLSLTPPELSGDIYERGLWLTGGGALIHGIADLLAKVTGINAYVAKNPLDCVAEGARIAVENINYYKDKAV